MLKSKLKLFFFCLTCSVDCFSFLSALTKQLLSLRQLIFFASSLLLSLRLLAQLLIEMLQLTVGELVSEKIFVTFQSTLAVFATARVEAAESKKQERREGFNFNR